MGIALLTFSGLFNGLSALQQRLTPPLVSAAPAQAPRVWRTARPSHRWPVSTRPLTTLGTAKRPAALRVLRVCESQASPGDTGRLVISGRLADVCAELDRMAACEAVQETTPLRH